jgi:hypothetical protein
MERSSETGPSPSARGGASHKADGPGARVSAPGFSSLYEAALGLPISRLHDDPSWCVNQLNSRPLTLQVS